MNANTIGISCATIHGLDKKVYFFEHKCVWAWAIMFEDHPLFTFNNLPWIYMAETETEARKVRRQYKKVFEKCQIHDGDKVAIIYDNDGVVAIGKNKEDCWIHVRDKFKAKTFKELNLSFDSLVVACNN